MSQENIAYIALVLEDEDYKIEEDGNVSLRKEFEPIQEQEDVQLGYEEVEGQKRLIVVSKNSNTNLVIRRVISEEILPRRIYSFIVKDGVFPPFNLWTFSQRDEILYNDRLNLYKEQSEPKKEAVSEQDTLVAPKQRNKEEIQTEILGKDTYTNDEDDMLGFQEFSKDTLDFLKSRGIMSEDLGNEEEGSSESNQPEKEDEVKESPKSIKKERDVPNKSVDDSKNRMMNRTPDIDFSDLDSVFGNVEDETIEDSLPEKVEKPKKKPKQSTKHVTPKAFVAVVIVIGSLLTLFFITRMKMVMKVTSSGNKVHQISSSSDNKSTTNSKKTDSKTESHYKLSDDEYENYKKRLTKLNGIYENEDGSIGGALKLTNGDILRIKEFNQNGELVMEDGTVFDLAWVDTLLSRLESANTESSSDNN